MPRNREEVRDLEDAPEDALERGLAGLDRAATELGAATLAVLVLEAASLEIAYCRPSAAGVPPQICDPSERTAPGARGASQVALSPAAPGCLVRCVTEERKGCGTHLRTISETGSRRTPFCAISPEMHQALVAESGPVPVDSAVARFLSSIVAPAAQSFLLFPWHARSRVVTIVFGFAEREPAHASVPAHVVESLNLAALAAWSVKEVTRLRAELRVVNGQFAARKLVERAKAALQAERGMSEQEAYEYLRKMSRQRRITLSKLAEDLLGAGRWP